MLCLLGALTFVDSVQSPFLCQFVFERDIPMIPPDFLRFLVIVANARLC